MLHTYMKRMWERVVIDRRQKKLAWKLLEKKRQELLTSMEDCRRQLEGMESLFAWAEEPHMIESCIYRQCALQAQYDGLLQQLRRLKQEGAVFGSAAEAVRIP